jgi:hypothetical protein
LSAWDEVQRRAQNDAQHNLPLDNAELQDWSQRVAGAYSSDARERGMLSWTYYNSFLLALRSVAAERGGRVLPTGNSPDMERIERQRWG